MNEKQTQMLESIAKSLSSLDTNFKLMIQQMEAARVKLAKENCACRPSINIGSDGDHKQSEK